MEDQSYCKNCGEALTGPHYCAHCGQKVINDRITVRHLFRRLISALTNLEKGLWFTMGALLRHPGKVINDFINGKTLPYTPPLRFTIIMGTLSVLLMLSMGNFDEMQESIQQTINPNVDEATLELQRKINEKIEPFLNLMPLLLVPFYALGSYLFFRKKHLNYAEHMVMHFFVYGISTALGFLLYIYYFASGSMNLAPILGLSVYSLFLMYTLRDLFKISWVSAFFKGLFAVVIGYIGFLFLFAVLGIIAAIIYFIINGGPPS